MFEHLAIITVICLAFFFKTIRLGYVSDDIPVHLQPPEYKNKFHYRWQQFTGERKVNPQQDHLITTLIHTINCCLLYLAFGATDISFIAALLYALNPSNNQSSVWISGRGYALPVTGLLAAMSCVWIAPIMLVWCTWWSVGFLAPFVLIGTSKFWLIPIAVFGWAYNYKKFTKAAHSKHSTETFTEDHRMHLGKFIAAIKSVGFYFSLGILPFKLTFYHNFMQSMAGNDISKQRAYTLRDKFFWIGLTVIVGGLTLYFREVNQMSGALIWFLIGIFPFCNLYRCNQESAERFMTIANIGLMVFLAHIIYPYPLLVASVLTLYATRLYVYYKTAYVDDYWLVEMAVQEDTKAWYAWHMRGYKRFTQGALREALNMFVMAKMMSPHEFKILFNIGSILVGLKQKEEGEHYLKEAEKYIVEGQEKEAKEVIEAARKGRVPVIL